MSRQMKDSGVEWIGRIPDEWVVYPARYAFSEVKQKNSDGTVQNALKFFNGTIIHKSDFDPEEDEYVANTITTYTIVEPNDIMINGLNLNYDFKTHRTGLVREKGAITSAYLALRPNERIRSKFATYLFKGYETRMALHNMGAGIRLTLGFKEFKNQPVLIPTIDEQERITMFLDDKCSQIDAIIEQTRASIEEYKKLKQAIITQTVTKGVRGERKMKDSGIEWIGEIPEEWEILPVGKELELIQTGPFGSQLHANEYISNGILVINPANIKNGKVVPDPNCSVTEEKLQELSRHLLYEGDIVFGRRGEMGRCAYIDKDLSRSICGTGCIHIRCGKTLEPMFLSYYLSNPCIKQYLELNAVGTTLQNLNTTIVSGIPVTKCSIEEQCEIVSFLDKKTNEIDSIVERKEKTLSELELYKKSLIYEYVTGKKEVPA